MGHDLKEKVTELVDKIKDKFTSSDSKTEKDRNIKDEDRAEGEGMDES